LPLSRGEIQTRDGGSVSVNIGIFWSICIGIGTGWIEKHSIGIGKYWYLLVVSVLVSVSANIGIF